MERVREEQRSRQAVTTCIQNKLGSCQGCGVLEMVSGTQSIDKLKKDVCRPLGGTMTIPTPRSKNGRVW